MSSTPISVDVSATTFTSSSTPSPSSSSYAVSCVDLAAGSKAGSSPLERLFASSNEKDVVAIATCVVCSLYLALGLLLILFGYRLFKLTLFCFGFLFGAVSLYAICQTKPEFLGGPLANYGVAVAAGVLTGLISTLVRWIGLFLVGLSWGVLLGIGALLIAIGFSFYDPASSIGVWMAIGVLLGAGLTSAILALYFQKSFCVIGSSAVGAALMSVGADFFVEGFFLTEFMWRVVIAVDRENVHRYYYYNNGGGGGGGSNKNDATVLTTRESWITTTTIDDGSDSTASLSSLQINSNISNNSTDVTPFGGGAGAGSGGERGAIDLDQLFCWYTWIILAAWPTFTLFGILFQGFLTGRRWDHRAADAGICGTGSSRRPKRRQRGQSGANANAGSGLGSAGGGGERGGGMSGVTPTDEEYANESDIGVIVHSGSSNAIGGANNHHRPKSPRSPKNNRHNRNKDNNSRKSQQQQHHRFHPVSTRDAGSVRAGGAPPTSLGGGCGAEFRHLYQKRRAAGDVISRDYIQSIHAQKSPGAVSSSSSSVSASAARGLAAGSSAASFDISAGGGGIGATSSHAISGLTDLESTLNSQHSRQSRSSQRSAATTSLSQHSVATMQSNIP